MSKNKRQIRVSVGIHCEQDALLEFPGSTDAITAVENAALFSTTNKPKFSQSCSHSARLSETFPALHCRRPGGRMTPALAAVLEAA